jgi:predicted amidohydrolase YtcJ
MQDMRTAFINGRIHTMDPVYADTSALAVQCGKVLAVGASEEVLALVRPGDELIDLHGRTVLPGLTDAHLHLHWYAQGKQRLDLRSVPSLDQVLARVAEWAEKRPADKWVLGRSWNQNLWPDRAFPTAADLDRVVPDRPVYLVAQSGHAGWANSLALELAGVTRDRSDPPGGRIRRDQEGRPTGILLEEAMNMVTEAIADPSAAEAAEVIRDALPDLWELGITGVHCMDGGAAFEALQMLHQERALKLRVLKYLPLERLDHAVAIGLRSGFGDDWLRVGGIKLFVDGALGVRTAALFEPYEGEPDNVGIPILEQAELEEIGRRASQAGLSLAIHAIGDRANRMALDVLEMFPAKGPIPHRIEHVQLLHPADLTRLAAQDVTASVQPVHAPSDMEMAERHWGERTRYAYAFRTLLENGTRLAFGSDAPVEPVAPLLGIHAAVTRRRLDGTPGPAGWHPEQRVSAHQAVLGFTAGPAQAAGRAHRTGTLTPGKLADLIVLDRDLLAVDPMEIARTRVLGTMIGGEWVRSLEI